MENGNNKHGFFYFISPILLCLGLSLASGIVLGVVAFAKFRTGNGTVSMQEASDFVNSCTHITYFVIYGILGAYCISKFAKNEKRCFDDKFQGGFSLKDALYALVCGASLNIAVEVLLVMIGGIVDISSLLNVHSQAIDGLMTDSLLINVLLLGIAAPIAEELMMRGLVFNRLRNELPEKHAMGLSALMFAFLHFPSVLQMGYAFLLGVVLAYAYSKYEKIYIPILIHAGFNLASFILMIPSVVNFFGTKVGLFVQYFLTVALCVLSYKILRNKEKPQPKQQTCNEFEEN